jgi:hypothetical protein
MAQRIWYQEAGIIVIIIIIIMYYKHITIVNDDSIMTLQVVASPTIIILKTLEVSFMLLAKIYSRVITHDDCHVMIVIYL